MNGGPKMKLNEDRLQHDEISTDVIEALSPINKEVTESYIEVIATLDTSDLALVIEQQFSTGLDAGGNIMWKNRDAMKPSANDYAYTVIVQAALHHLYPEAHILVDADYGPKTKEFMLRFFDDYGVSYSSVDTGWAGPKAFAKLYDLFTEEGPSLSQDLSFSDAEALSPQEVVHQEFISKGSLGVPSSLSSTESITSLATAETVFSDFDLEEYPHREQVGDVWQYRNRFTGYFDIGVSEGVNIEDHPDGIIITVGLFSGGSLVSGTVSGPFSNFATKSTDGGFVMGHDDQYRKEREGISVTSTGDLVRIAPPQLDGDSLTDIGLDSSPSALE